jgi:Xaa-Pro dipeptidase
LHVPEFADALKDLLAADLAAGDKIGISGWGFFPAPTYVGLTAAFPDVTFSDETDILTRLRVVKSEAELALIRAACRVTDRAMRASLEATHEGVTEVEIAAAADGVIRTSGAEPSFIYEVGSGTRTATGISVPTDRRVARGELVMIDVGGMLDAVGSSHGAAVAAIRPGLTVRELNAAAADAVASLGLGEYWSGDFMPHGLGTTQHEPPEGPKHFDMELQAGMVLAIEPVVVVPGVGGAIAEHMIVVTDGGAEELSEIPIDVWRSFT